MALQNDGPKADRFDQMSTEATNSEKKNERGKIVTISNSGGAPAVGVRKKNKKKRSLLPISFVLLVILPMAALVTYFTEYATDRYAARAGFSIRGIDAGQQIDGLGAITGLASSGSTTSDSYVVLSFLKSRALVEALDERVGLREVYSAPEIDVISRLPAESTVEQFVDYWSRRIKSQFDPTSGIIEFEVQSFSPEHAKLATEEVLKLVQELVNSLSASARQDTLRFAREELALQEKRLKDVTEKIRQFRTTEQSVDPAASAALEIQLLSNLEAQLIDLNARIAVQSNELDPNAPSLVALRRGADALTKQIEDRRSAIGDDILSQNSAVATSDRLARYEELEVERALAHQTYASALSSLEQARRDADRQQRYLAIHLRPQIAQEAEYPKKLRDTLLAGFILVALWSIGSLIAFSVKDHLT